jgi:hypothetical protein
MNGAPGAGVEPASCRDPKVTSPLPSEHPGMRAPPRCRAGLPPLQGAGGRRSEGRRSCARCDSNARCPAIGLRARGAATRCRPGSPALRGQGRSRARWRGFRGWTRTSGGRGQGPAGDAIAPPGIKGPGLRCRCESVWLPASRARARGGSRTRIRQFLRLAALPVGCTRASCAARGSNSAPQIKSLMHHHNACSA